MSMASTPPDAMSLPTDRPWRVLSRRERKPGADGEDWSAERSEAALVTHVRERVDHYLGLPVVQRVLDGFGSFERGLRS